MDIAAVDAQGDPVFQQRDPFLFCGGEMDKNLFVFPVTEKSAGQFTDFRLISLLPSVGNIAYASTLPRRIPLLDFIHYN